MAILNLRKRQSDEEFAAMFSYMTDEELVDKAFWLGRDTNFERFLLPHERGELRGIKAELLSRLRKRNPPA